jgi:hypothetical protein
LTAGLNGSSVDVGPLSGVLERAEELEAPPPLNPLGLRDVSEWVGEPPPVAWISKRLHLAPGRPMGLIGYAGVGKTLLAADLALAVAGRPEHASCWGGVKIDRQGPVVHIDLEVGQHLLRTRYHRLAQGRWAHISEWAGRLSWTSYPAWNLAAAEAEEQLCQTLDGKALAVIDSLVVITPGVDENSARISDYLKILPRASERTGCAIVLLHHAGRPPADGPRALEQEGRGSTGIEAIWGSKWVVRPLEDVRALFVGHGKTQYEGRQEGILTRIDPVGEPDAEGTYPGVRFLAVRGRTEGDDPVPVGERVRALDAVMARVLDAVRAVGRTNRKGLDEALKGEGKGKSELKNRAIAQLVERGDLVRVHVGREAWFAVAGTPDANELLGTSQTTLSPGESVRGEGGEIVDPLTLSRPSPLRRGESPRRGP